MNTITVTPRLGRDYKSKKDLLEHWNENKDFTVATTGQSVSKSLTTYLIKEGYTHVQFRYKQLRSTFLHKLELEDANTHN